MQPENAPIPPQKTGKKTDIYSKHHVFWGSFQPSAFAFQVLERRLDASDASDLFDEVAVRLGTPCGEADEVDFWT